MASSSFYDTVLAARSAPLRALELDTLQVNLGYRCNLACRHCHVGGGPGRPEMMEETTIGAVLAAVQAAAGSALDITGGAPEMNPGFRRLVAGARGLGRRVVVRTNLAVLFESGMEDLPEFYRDQGVELVASLPYYLEDNVDRVRGSGTFRKCIDALRRLNGLGFGKEEGRILNLVYNPQGAFLAPGQDALEAEYRRELGARFGIAFSRLFAFTNMPIGRFREFLVRTGNLEKYMTRLVCAFNPATFDGLMCRRLVSVGWDGRLHDCDFNQVLGIPVHSGAPAHIREFDAAALARRVIEVGDHCFGCAAGQGST